MFPFRKEKSIIRTGRKNFEGRVKTKEMIQLIEDRRSLGTKESSSKGFGTELVIEKDWLPRNKKGDDDTLDRAENFNNTK